MGQFILQCVQQKIMRISFLSHKDEVIKWEACTYKDYHTVRCDQAITNLRQLLNLMMITKIMKKWQDLQHILRWI